MPNVTDHPTPRWNLSELITALVTIVALLVSVAVVAWGSLLRMFATIGVVLTVAMLQHLSPRNEPTPLPPPPPTAPVKAG